MSGEFQELADKAALLWKNIATLIVCGVLFFFVVGPYFLWKKAANDIVKSNPANTRVWIAENNIAIDQETNGGKVLPYPQPITKIPMDFYGNTKGENGGCPTHSYYVMTKSIKEAEDWALRNGYKRTLLTTSDYAKFRSSGRFVDKVDSVYMGNPKEFYDYYNPKEFLVKNIPGTKAYSVLCFMVDYGDYDIHLIPYRYARGQSPVNYGRFPQENFEATGGIENTPWGPPLPWESCEKVASTVWGRGHSGNSSAVQSFLTTDRTDEDNLKDYLKSVLMSN